MYPTIAEWIVDIGFLPRNVNAPDDLVAKAVLSFLNKNISQWEWWRSLQYDTTRYVPEQIVAETWTAYVRIATIELAVRIAAGMIVAGVPRDRAGFIQYVAESRPGDYLKNLQKGAGMTREQLAEELAHSDNTVDTWLDKDSKPHSDALHNLATLFARSPGFPRAPIIEGDLRRLYLLDYIAELLSEFVGADVVTACLEKLSSYIDRSYDSMIAVILSGQDPDAAGSVFLSGTGSPAAQQVLRALVSAESSAIWKKELESAHLPWQVRVTLDMVESLESGLGQLHSSLSDVNPEEIGLNSEELGEEARQIIDKAMIFWRQRKLLEAEKVFAELAELEPANAKIHEFIGLSKKALGEKAGNTDILEQALDSFWLAATLDNSDSQDLESDRPHSLSLG